LSIELLWHEPKKKASPRDHDLREHIPVPYDNLFQSILSSRHAVKVIFSLGPMVRQAMANGHQVVSI